VSLADLNEIFMVSPRGLTRGLCMLAMGPRDGGSGGEDPVMMGWYDGGMGGFGPVVWMFMLVFWIALIALIVFLVAKLLPGTRDVGTPPAPAVQESPEEILDRMFALGEIDEETYRARRSALSEMRKP
jgi:putative membrane protein